MKIEIEQGIKDVNRIIVDDKGKLIVFRVDNIKLKKILKLIDDIILENN